MDDVKHLIDQLREPVWGEPVRVVNDRLRTAALFLQSLMAELEQVERERDGLNILLAQAQSMLETRTRERDAAIADMERLQGLICQVCKEYYQPDPKIRKYSCKIYGEYFGEIAEDGLLCCSKFKWRGLQE